MISFGWVLWLERFIFLSLKYFCPLSVFQFYCIIPSVLYLHAVAVHISSSVLYFHAVAVHISSSYTRRLLLNPSILDILRENYVCWGWNMTSIGAHRLQDIVQDVGWVYIYILFCVSVFVRVVESRRYALLENAIFPFMQYFPPRTLIFWNHPSLLCTV